MLGDSSFPLIVPVHFPRVCLGSSAELLDSVPWYPDDWIKELVIWGLECRQQGAMVLNVVSGPGLLAGDGRMCWAGQSGWQYLTTPGIGITDFISGLPFQNRPCVSLLSN